MNKLEIIVNEDGSVGQFTPDFKIIRGSYRNVLLNIKVPHSLLIDPVNDTGDGTNQTGNNVRIGAIIRTATGQNLQTQRYEFQRVKDYILNGVYYRLYQRRMPKEFTMWETVNLLEATNSGVLEMVINITNWTLDENSNAKIEEVAASQIFTLDIYPSAFLENAEEIDEPSDFDELQSQVQEIDATIQTISDKTDEALEKSEEALETSKNAESVANNIDAKATEALEKSEEAKSIALSKTNNKSFDNYEELIAFISDETNKGLYLIGSLLLLKEQDVPDYWITDVLITPNADGYYYEIAEMEATVLSINGEKGEVVLDADDISDTTTLNKFATIEQLTQIATNKENIEHKADKVLNGTIDNITKLTSDGNLADSGKKISDLILVIDIQDNLTSTDIEKPLSANQGTVIKSSIDTLSNKVAAQAGIGGYLTAYNFGTAAPTQAQLTNYALSQIPEITFYNEIFNGTRVKNTFNNHLWVLTNVMVAEPFIIFEWTDNGLDTVLQATATTLGVVKSSNTDLKIKVETDGTMTVNNLTTNMSRLANTSGSNTGDETESTIKTKLGITAISGENTGDQDLSSLVPNTRTVNEHALTGNITVSKADVGLGNVYNPTAYGGISYGGGAGEAGVSFTDLDILAYTGFYTCFGTTANVPSSSYSWFIEHINSNVGTTSATQIATAYATTTIIYIRHKISNNWGSWENISPLLKENVSNKVVGISSSSTDTEYPSAKCVYDIVGDIETLLGGI